MHPDDFLVWDELVLAREPDEERRTDLQVGHYKRVALIAEVLARHTGQKLTQGLGEAVAPVVVVVAGGGGLGCGFSLRKAGASSSGAVSGTSVWT